MFNAWPTRLIASAFLFSLFAAPVPAAEVNPGAGIGGPVTGPRPITPISPYDPVLIGITTLESRLGFIIIHPLLVFDNGGTLNYTAGGSPNGGLMQILSDPLAIQLTPAAVPFAVLPFAGDDFLSLSLVIDETTGEFVEGVPGDDFQVVGQADINNDGMLDVGGVLLTGEVVEYMGEDSGGSTDFHDFRVRITGGELAYLYTSGQIGINMTSESSSFDGSYTQDFAGESKGTLGRIPCKAVIGNFVWIDTNQNGIQDPGEPGIPDVELILTDEFGGVQTTTTNVDGEYKFADLCKGTYTIEVNDATIPPGLDPTLINAPGSTQDNDSNDPDGTTVVIPADSGEDLTYDFGYIPVEPASLGDYVWNDLNMDGVQDGSEPPIAGVMVNLYDCDGNFLGSTTTDAVGFYEFTNLSPGCYQVEFILPPGFVFSPMDQTGDTLDSDPDPTTGFTDPVNLASGEHNPDVDAGMFQPLIAELGDRFWEDVNGNGIQDPGEPGIPGVTVNLYDCGGALLDSTVTGASGDYLFPDLPAGCYVIGFEPPQDCVLTLQDVGNDADDSDADPATGLTTQINLADMQSDLTWDAGCYYTAALGDFVWNDLNQDGIQDPGEPGIEGLTVVLLDSLMMPTGMSTVTGPAGDYQFTGLPPGSYFVQFTAPAGFVFTLQDVGADDTDSDANGTGKSDKITLSSGEFDPTIDAGVYLPNDPSISIEKSTNGEDADNPTGPFIPNGDPVLWEYVVTNTGNVTLTGIFVTDDQGVAVNCPTDTLAPTEMMTCTGNGNATVDQYENVGDTCGTDPAGTQVCDDDPSHYFGADPAIDIEKATNGDDADLPTGPYITPGAAVTWTYVVQNTGNVPLSDVTVTDDQGVTVTCPLDSLTPGQIMTCMANGTAVAGQYANVGSVVGTPPPGAGDPVDDMDPSHYFGALPGIDIEKATNGEDADAPTGPFISVGGAVNWTYVVTNTGNVPLTNVTVTDSQGVAVACPDTTLAPSGEPGDSFICTANGTATAGQYENLGTVTGDPPQGPPVDDEDPSHYYGADPAIDIEKATNGDDADTPTGPVVAVGSTVNWTYVVTNTGNVDLTDVTVTDSQGVTVSCPMDTLAVGDSFTCTASGLATAGQYMNNSTVVGTPPVGDPVMDEDPSHYFGADPDIDIEKATNGDDADAPTGPVVAVGSTVSWTYLVTNTGNVDLNNVTVTDNQGVPVSCPSTTLAVGASFTCTGTGIATAGQYANLGSVCGTDETGAQVCDDDPSHYFGADPDIDIEKATNGDDADAPTGPVVAVGSTVNWTYLVTNTGNVPLSNVTVTDNQGVAVSCPSDTLAVGASFTCTGSGIATAGQYANLGTVCGNDVTGGQVCDEDPSHYFGADPSIDVEKATNGVDADDPNAGDAPQLAPGDVVNWTYLVTNTGNVGLDNITVIDDQGVAVTCPATSLAPGASFTCTASGFAEDVTNTLATTVMGMCGTTPNVPLYENTGIATGTAATGQSVTDSDLSHYCNGFCVVAAISDPLYARFDGTHAFTLPGIDTNLAFLPDAGTFNENPSTGTAVLAGRLGSRSNPSNGFDVVVNLSGATTIPGPGSPKKELLDSAYIENGGPVDPSTWRYYTNYTGTLVGFGAYAGSVVDIATTGPAFQIGVGANNKNILFGASSWFDYWVTSQPNNGSFPHDGVGDINVELKNECEPDVCVPGDVADHFNSNSFNNNDGSSNWSTSWIEDDVASPGPASGNVFVSLGKLQLKDRPDTGTHPSAAREADLSGAVSATLSFDFWTTAEVDASDAVTLEISNDGGATYQTLEVFTNIDGSSDGSRSIDISGYISSQTRIRFRVSANYGGDKEHFKIDNVKIDFDCVAPPPCVPGDVADHFNHDAYDNNDGSLDWSTPWMEYDVAGDPAWAATTGNVRISSGKLKLSDNPDTGTHPSIAREVNLEDNTGATLHFDFWTTSGVDHDDAVTLEISDDGGATYTTLEVFTGISGASDGWRSYDISAYMSAETRIRFRVSDYYGADNEFFKIDAVRIECTCD